MSTSIPQPNEIWLVAILEDTDYGYTNLTVKVLASKMGKTTLGNQQITWLVEDSDGVQRWITRNDFIKMSTDLDAEMVDKE
jgi:hypothetical protein